MAVFLLHSGDTNYLVGFFGILTFLFQLTGIISQIDCVSFIQLLFLPLGKQIPYFFYLSFTWQIYLLQVFIQIIPYIRSNNANFFNVP